MSQEIGFTRTIDRYIPLVHFLGVFLGSQCEIVLHDVGVKEKSVLAIANGHISGRAVGAPLTDLSLTFLKSKEYMKSDWVMGYKTQSSDGHPLHSATYFIREDDGTLAGMLCLNMDTSDVQQAQECLQRFIKATGVESDTEKGSPESRDNSVHFETFTDNIESLTEGIIRKVIDQAEVDPERMTTDEKMKIMRRLNERGVFLLKGAVSLVAVALAASEATIYRYLQKIS